MEEMPIMEPPRGVWVDIWVAAAWIELYAPVRFVVRVEDQSFGVMLFSDLVSRFLPRESHIVQLYGELTPRTP